MREWMGKYNIRRRCQLISKAAVLFVFEPLDFLFDWFQNIGSGLLTAGLSDDFTLSGVQSLLIVG